MRTPIRLAIASMACLTFFLAGCSDPLNRDGDVSGRVTIDGEPVTAGNVLMVSEDGKWTGSGSLKGDGTYVVKEPPLGLVKIAVETEMYRDMGGRNAGGGGGAATGSAGMVLPDPKERGLVYKAIPAKYERIQTSGLTHVIERGKKTFDIELKSE